MDWGISQEGCFDRVIIVQGASRLPGQEARLFRAECPPQIPCSRRGGIPMSGQGEGAFGAKITGVPGGTVPVRYGEAKGIFSFEKRMSPRPPKEKRGGISISPRTPLKRHKGAGCGPNTVMAIRFPALMGRQSCHFLESTSLYPPPAALWCFPLWKFLPRKDGGATVEREAEDVLFATPVCEGLSGAGTH